MRNEWREREERKKNILLRGLKVKEGGEREGVECLMKSLGVKVKIKWARQLGTGRKEREREYDFNETRK